MRLSAKLWAQQIFQVVIISSFLSGCVGIEEGPSLILENYREIERDVEEGGVLEVSMDPDDNLDFGSMYVSNPEQVTLTIKNVGPGSVTLGTLTGLGSGFSATGGTCTASLLLAAQETCTLTVRYVASSAGTITPTFTLPYKSGSATKTISATGSATASLAPLCGVATSTTEISVYWSHLDGDEVVLAVQEGSSAPTSCSGGTSIPNTSPYSITGLTPGTTYTYVICGKASGTPIIATAPVTTTTTEATPDPFQLVANPSASGSDSFGFSVAVSGSKALIGNPIPNRTVFNGRGEVLAFKLSGGVWTYSQTLTGTYLNDGYEDSFGYSIAMKGSDAVIGAPKRQNIAGNFTETGAAFYFKYNSSSLLWEQKKVLTASSVDQYFNQYSRFGHSVAIADGIIAVGAPGLARLDSEGTVTENRAGAVHVYEGSDTNWTESRIIPDDHSDEAKFGTSVALANGRVYAGAINGTATDEGAGSVYEFAKDGSWTQTAEIGPPTSVNNTSFGGSLSVDGAVMAVGDPDYNSGAGWVFIFRRPVATWTYSHGLTDLPDLKANGAIKTGFGTSVALTGNKLIIGAPKTTGTGSTSNAGVAYLYKSTDGNPFSYVKRYRGSQAGLYEGGSVAISDVEVNSKNTMMMGGTFMESDYTMFGDGKAYFLDESYEEPS